MSFRDYTLATVLLVACLGSARAGEIAYRWVDTQGVVHFSDEPPAEEFAAEAIPLPEYEPPPAPTASELAAQKKLAQIQAYLERRAEERRAADKLARARAEAAALRAQLQAERRQPDYQPLVHGIWFPRSFPRPEIPDPPPVQPPMQPPSFRTSNSRFDRLAEAMDRLGPGPD